MTDLDPHRFIHQHYYGVLSTHSASESGYPFGSITPYIVTDGGDLAIFVSHLAEHTRNINKNPKVSLTIFDVEDETTPSAGPRITCLADAYRAEEHTSLKAKYLEKFSDSDIILELDGFQFYILKLNKIRLVAGFGDAKWLTPEQFSL
jgi:heme oxygenase (biliverdin-IX-beta and delta-forming)